MPEAAPKQSCPCGAGRSFVDCCQPFLEGLASAPTAAALMRSRYSAYVKGDADYLVRTHHPNTCGNDLEASIRDWMSKVSWLGLEVVRVENGGPRDKQGKVEFRATFASEGKVGTHHEIARFKKSGGQWRYFDGRYPS